MTGDPNAHILALIVNPANADQLLAATTSGIYFSGDGGSTWDPTGWNNGLPSTKRAMAIVPIDWAGGIFLATFYGGADGEAGGVYKREGAGLTWVRKVGVDKDRWFDLVKAPDGFWATRTSSANPARNPAVYKGSLDGNTWTRELDMVDHQGQRYELSWVILGNASKPTELAIAEHSGYYSVWLAAFGPGQIFRMNSNDSIQPVWKQMFTDPVPGIGGVTWRGRGIELFGPSAIVFDADVEGRMYVGYQGHGFFKSTDGGVSWKNTFGQGQYQEGAQNDVRTIALDPLNGQILWMGARNSTEAHGGVYRSGDFGETWELMGGEKDNKNGLPDGMLLAVAVRPDNSNHIFAIVANANPSGPTASGVYRTRDEGTSWESLTSPTAGGPRIDPGEFGFSGILEQNRGLKAMMFIDTGQPRYVYVGLKGGLWRTSNANDPDAAAVTWEQLQEGEIQGMVGDPQQPQHLFFAYDNDIWRTMNARTVSPGGFEDIFQETVSGVQALAINPNNSDMVVLARIASQDSPIGVGVIKRTSNALAPKEQVLWTDNGGTYEQSSMPNSVAVEPFHTADPIIWFGAGCNGIWRRDFSVT